MLTSDADADDACTGTCTRVCISKKFLTRKSSGGHQARKRKKGRKKRVCIHFKKIERTCI
jgi:hypothetical protein